MDAETETDVNNSRFDKLKKRLIKEAKKAENKGVCYLSRIPPKMDPLKLRQLLSSYGEVLRIYLVPEGLWKLEYLAADTVGVLQLTSPRAQIFDDILVGSKEILLNADPEAGMRRKKVGGFRGQTFSEGWVEFSDKRVAKRVANMLNGEQIGETKRSQFYYDIWNIKYLSKFKWDNLTEETARKHVVREEKLRMELGAAKKERDFFISKVEKSRALSEIEQRMKKKRKAQNGIEQDSEHPMEQRKVIRQFPQTQPLAGSAEMGQQKLSKDVLAKIFNKRSET